MLTSILHKVDNLRCRGFAKSFLNAHFQHARQINRTRDDTVAGMGHAGHALPCQRNSVKSGLSFQYATIHGHSLTRAHLYDFPHANGCRLNGLHFSLALHMSHIGTNIHQFCNRLTTPILSIMFEEFTYLKEKHHKDRFGKLCGSSGQETNEKRTKSSDAHEQVLIERFALHDALNRFSQHIVACNEVRHEKN